MSPMASSVHWIAIASVCFLGVISDEIDLSKLPKKVTFPPKILSEPEKEIAYKVGTDQAESITLPCIARGDPQPEYHWEFNGEVVDFYGRTDIRQEPGKGTMVIDEPDDQHEGLYQCFASNSHGKAVGIKTKLRKAVLGVFDTVRDPHVHHVETGTSIVLRCSPPESYPSATVFWGQTIDDRPVPISNTDRITLDYEGSLYFANIISSDYLNGNAYVCTVYNMVIRGQMQGEDQKIAPIEVTPHYRAPKIMWTSETMTVATKGSTKKMKCIFSGYPTPKVTWTRKGSPLSPRATMHEFGMELVIENVEYEDQGTYECAGTNQQNGVPVTRNIELQVESMPFWIEEPESVNTAEEESAEFTCKASGRPAPTITWSSNGVAWQDMEADLPADERRLTARNTIFFRNVTRTDSQVLQCNASNTHGYVFANVFLNVLAEPPTFMTAPDAVTKKAEGQSATLSCRVFGAPEPVITWTLNGTELRERRFVVTEDGDLEIHDIRLSDRGNYECKAVNKFGQISENGQLVVRERTLITDAPQDKQVNATTDVVFECDATTDPLEFARLKIQWFRDGNLIDFTKERRLRLNVNDNSLTIVESRVDDSGEYKCRADNGLDSDEVTAQLTVKDKPDPPRNVRNVRCVSLSADIAWEAGNSNNDDIFEYIIYYNTSFDDPGVFHEEKRVSGMADSVTMTLSPWADYTFHVRARNRLGVSEPSSFTTKCTTQPDIPYKHPQGVCVESRDPSQLVIVWEPMQQMDHNGENFHYIVNYKRMDIRGATPQSRRVYDWRASEVVINGQPSFKPYEIFVEAYNQIGPAPPSGLTKKKGYSGEGVPSASPSGLRIDESSLNSTSAVFEWDPMDTGPEVMKGLFTGYEIHYWKSEDPSEKKVHEIVEEPGVLCSDLGSDMRGRRRRRQAAQNDAHILDLWPYAAISAGILAKNAGNKGALSEPYLSFSTPEGVPGEVEMLEVREKGSHHIGVAWGPPIEPNGIILGYDVGYQKANSPMAPIIPLSIDNPAARSATIKDLDDDTPYKIYVWARTVKGRGTPYFIEDSTLPAAPPDKPVFADIDVGDNSVNVSWTPSEKNKKPAKNPGTDFYAEYRNVKDGDDAEWLRADPNDPDQNWANITGLGHGDMYEIRVVAVNGRGVETRSNPKRVRIGPHQEPLEQSVHTAGWFIGMMCAIIFLLIILLIVCLIKRNRGGKYPVHEKEKLRGRDPDKDDEEGGFGEYTRTPTSRVEDPADHMWSGRSRPVSSGSTIRFSFLERPYMELKSDEPDYKKSAGSINSDKLSGGSDDSLAEYDNMDPSKFNEDGSFIGIYAGKSKKDDKISPPDATSPSALSTFV